MIVIWISVYAPEENIIHKSNFIHKVIPTVLYINNISYQVSVIRPCPKSNTAIKNIDITMAYIMIIFLCISSKIYVAFSFLDAYFGNFFISQLA